MPPSNPTPKSDLAILQGTDGQYLKRVNGAPAAASILASDVADIYRPAGSHLASRHRANAGVIAGSAIAAGSALFTAASSQHLFAADTPALRVGPAGLYTCGWVRFASISAQYLWGKGARIDWSLVEWLLWCDGTNVNFWKDDQNTTESAAIRKELESTAERYAARIPGLAANTWDQRTICGDDWALLGDAAGFADDQRWPRRTFCRRAWNNNQPSPRACPRLPSSPPAPPSR